MGSKVFYRFINAGDIYSEKVIMEKGDFSLKAKVLKGAAWLSIGTFLGQSISWISTIIVIRLLLPEDYGLMAMANIFISFLVLMSEIGISAAIIQSEQITENELKKIFGLVIIASSIFFLLSYFISPAVALFFNEERLTSIIRFLSLNFILMAMYIVPQSLFIREMDFQSKAKVDIFSQVGTSLLTLILALKGMGIWALVMGTIAMHMIRTIGFNISRPYLIKPVFQYKGVENFMKYGVTVTGDRLLYYLHTESDKIIVGKFFGNSLLGIYAVALNLSSMIMEKILPIITQISFTAYSRIQNDTDRINRNILKASHAVAFLGFPLFFSMAGAAPEAIPLILGLKWKTIIVPFQLFCFIMPLKALSPLLAPAIFAIGKPKINLVNMGITFIFMSFALLIGAMAGLLGVCVAWVLVYPLVFLITTKRSLIALNIPFRVYIAEIKFPFFASALMLIIMYFLKNLVMIGFQPLFSLIMIMLFFVIFWTIVILFKREEYSKIRDLLQK